MRIKVDKIRIKVNSIWFKMMKHKRQNKNYKSKAIIMFYLMKNKLDKKKFNSKDGIVNNILIIIKLRFMTWIKNRRQEKD